MNVTFLIEMILFSFLDGIIGIDFLDLIRCHGGDADVVFDHQLGKPPAVNKDDFAVDVVYVLNGIFAEIRGSNEDPFPSPLALERSGEFLDFV